MISVAMLVYKVDLVLDRITTLKTRGTVRAVVGAPGGGWLLVMREEAGTWSPRRLIGAEIYRRTEAGLEKTGEPAPAPTMFVLDDGTAIGVHEAYNEVEVNRHGADGVHQASFIAMRGMSLGQFAFVLESDGEHLTIRAIDRDDGHGHSQPIYTVWCVRVDLRSGEPGPGEPEPHLLRGPGVPTRSGFDGGDPVALQARIADLPFRREWPRRVGPTRLLTTDRVIDVATGATVLGPRSELFDLSAGERLVVGAHHGRFELHDLERGAVVAELDSKHSVRCAAFLTPREIVVGTAEGRVLLLGLPA